MPYTEVQLAAVLLLGFCMGGLAATLWTREASRQVEKRQHEIEVALESAQRAEALAQSARQRYEMLIRMEKAGSEASSRAVPLNGAVAVASDDDAA